MYRYFCSERLQEESSEIDIPLRPSVIKSNTAFTTDVVEQAVTDLLEEGLARASKCVQILVTNYVYHDNFNAKFLS